MKNVVLLLAGMSCFPAAAQSSGLIGKIRAANQRPDMEYDYRIVLRDMNQKRDTDSTLGHIAVRNGQYLDSNRYAFTARVGDYFCKLDHVKKTATVCNMKELAKKMGVSLENNEYKYAFNISDSVMWRQGALSIDSSDTRFYRVRIRMKNHTLSYAQMDFSRTSYLLLGAYFEALYKDPHDPSYQYRSSIEMSRVRHIVQQGGFDLGSIYTLSNGKAILNKKYAHYHLIP